MMATAGFDLLSENGHLSEFPRPSPPPFERRARVSDLTLRHELEVMDAKAAIAAAVGWISNLKVIEFTTWPMLCQFDVHLRSHAQVRVKPDGLIRVEEEATNGAVYEHTIFLEVDRGTETLDTLAHRAACYREHYSSGGHAASFGAPREAYADYPFRVLMVLPSEERRNNLAERLLSLSPPIETQVWCTTSADLSANPLGAIWIRPRDYREATRDSSFDVRAGERDTHKRRSEREQRVRQHAARHALFSE